LKTKNIYRFINVLIAGVWLVNGLFCKVLNLVPRHQEIVAEILGETFARPLTFAIGCLEVCMCIWVLSGIKSRLSASLQIGIVLLMNVIEFFAVPDLLLWGKLNFVFAFLFVITVYINEFKIKKS